MTDKEIIRLLPTQPLCEVLKATMECPELHPSFITFKRVSVETGRIEWQELMTPEDIDRIAKASKRRWGALCHCTFCGENFYTGWHSHRDMSGPLMFIGDDESLYPGWTEDIDDGNQRIEITEGDQGNCPMCGEGATFVKYGALKTGRTYQRLFASIEFVGDLAAIVTWLAGCSIDADGVSDEYILPRDAAVLTERGFLRCYTQSRKGQFITCERNTGTWQRVKQKSDPMQKMFYTYDACCGRCFGVERLLLTYGSFDGTSAEKTGLTMDEIINMPQAEEGDLVVKFSKPFVFENKTYTEVDLRNLENLNGEDLCRADRAVRAQGNAAQMTEMTPDIACFLGSVAAHLPVEFFKTLPIREMFKVRNAVSGFLFGGDE